MIRSAIIVVLLVVVAVLADRVVREENQRYALLLGMCAQQTGTTPDLPCLDEVQSRSAWGWHLFYGLTSQIPAVPWTSK